MPLAALCSTIIIICSSLGAMIPEPAEGQPGVVDVERLVLQLGSRDAGEREAATKSLVSIGWPALNALLRARESRDPEVAGRSALVIRSIGQRNLCRFQGMDLISAIRECGKRVEVELGSTVDVQALARFCRQDPSRLVLLFASLYDTDEEVRLGAIMLLQDYRPVALLMVPRVHSLLQSEQSPMGRLLMLSVLYDLLVAPECSLPPAMKLIAVRLLEPTFLDLAKNDPVGQIRSQALFALREGKTASNAAINLFRNALNDNHIDVRLEAARGLLMHIEADTAVNTILQSISTSWKELLSDDPEGRCVATCFAEALSLAGPRAVPALYLALNSDKPMVRACAALALGYISNSDQEKDEPERMTNSMISGITRLLNDEHALVRYSAANALSHLGSRAAQSIPRLLELRHDENTDVRAAASHALRLIRPQSECKK